MADKLKITVVCDNHPHTPGLQTGWGFACLITGTEKTILFDTGPGGKMLLDNMNKLAIDPDCIDAVVLSHNHPDHTGGLKNLLESNAKATVYLPAGSWAKLNEKTDSDQRQIVRVDAPLQICRDVYSTGGIGRLIKEQSLIIRTQKGLITITGCAHPGIARILDTVKNFLKKDILLLMGGFHLEWTTKSAILKTIDRLRLFKVKYVAPAHCCGPRARALLKEAFADRYINVGAGAIVFPAELPS